MKKVAARSKKVKQGQAGWNMPNGVKLSQTGSNMIKQGRRGSSGVKCGQTGKKVAKQDHTKSNKIKQGKTVSSSV